MEGVRETLMPASPTHYSSRSGESVGTGDKLDELAVEDVSSLLIISVVVAVESSNAGGTVAALRMRVARSVWFGI